MSIVADRRSLNIAFKRIGETGLNLNGLIVGILKNAKEFEYGIVIDREDQLALGAFMGARLHQIYCDGRKLDKPNENGLNNNPRLKKLTDPMDAEFVEKVKSGEIEQSPTLFIDENGIVVMDIANTLFENLSPYWQNDNFKAGCAAARSVLTCYKLLRSKDENVKKAVEYSVANAIHESWIARGNIYYDVAGGNVYTNEDLETAFINLSSDEKKKDVDHIYMAQALIDEIYKEMSMQNKGTVSGDDE